MTARFVAPAAAALLGLASPALAFHPIQHLLCCPHTHHHHAAPAPRTVQPFAVQPQFVQPQFVQPFAVQPQFVQPQFVQPFAVQPQFVQPQFVQPQFVQTQGVQLQGVQVQGVQAQGATADAQALNNLGSLLNLLKTGCAVINPGTGKVTPAPGISAAEAKRINRDIDTLFKKAGLERPKPTADDGSSDGRREADEPSSRITPKAAADLAAIDAGLTEIEALQRRTAALRAARQPAAPPALPPAEPALAGRR